MRGLFLPSMIEVEFGRYYKKCSELLFNKGFNYFHIDFGDNELIGRELNPWDKVRFLKSLGNEIKLAAHIMSISGNHSLSVEKITKRCLNEGFEIIYIHPRSFKDLDELLKFKNEYFKNNHNIFGIVSEINEGKDDLLIDFIVTNSIKNLLQMSVPIGKGGQSFVWSAIDRIKEFKLYCSELSSIEIDGGLTLKIIGQLKGAKINRFAGWSIISDPVPEIVLSNAYKVLNLI